MSQEEQSKAVFDAAEAAALRLLKDPGEAWLVALATREKFLQVVRDRPAKPVNDPAAWAARVARYRCLDMFRALAAKKRDLTLIDGNVIDTQPGLSPFLKNVSESPATELLQMVLRKLGELEPDPDIQQAFLDYFGTEGRTVKALASSLKLNEKTLYSKLNRLHVKVLLTLTQSMSPDDLDDWRQLHLQCPTA